MSEQLKENIIPPDIYTREYYLTDNEGCHEYAKGLDHHMHDKFERALRLANIQANENVLDVGCGRGELVYYAIKKGANHALGIDYSQAAIGVAQETIQKLPEEDRSKAEAHVGAAESFPYTKKYDVIFFLEIAEHMHDWQLKETFEKFDSILNTNGRLICITPNYHYETKLQPLKLYSNIPFNFLRCLRRMITKKFRPANAQEFWQKVFRLKVSRGELNEQMHCNVLTPKRFEKHLQKFTTHIYCDDPSKNLFTFIFKKWWGRDIIAIASKKTS